ncbi:unnamed protein product [Oikopleura dioica]|uniref:Uncharacterized protein n=1 Tax=Oikopleura dioica TaxID=34765 RepID=E4Y1A8_OIKDI|nr:unnamed protein product [Oikopleura dioica]
MASLDVPNRFSSADRRRASETENFCPDITEEISSTEQSAAVSPNADDQKIEI